MLRTACCPAFARAALSSARTQTAGYYSRRQIPDPPAQPGTYDDILKLQAEIDAAVWERGDLREATLPLQVDDNRLRAEFKTEEWKLRCFDKYREMKARPPLTPEEREEMLRQREENRERQQRIKQKKAEFRARDRIEGVERRAEKKKRDAQKKIEKDIRSVGENPNAPIDPEKREWWELYQDKKRSVAQEEGLSLDPDAAVPVDKTTLKSIIKKATAELALKKAEELKRSPPVDEGPRNSYGRPHLKPRQQPWAGRGKMGREQRL